MNFNKKITLLVMVIMLVLHPISAKGKQENSTVQKISPENLQKVQQLLAKSLAAAEGVWDGPKTGPPAQGKHLIIFVGSDMTNGGVLAVSKGAQQAITAIGWKMEILDGQGAANNQVSALDQAIARRPDGIVIGGWNPNAAKKSLLRAKSLEIPIVGWHAVSKPGPVPEFNMYFNITTDALMVARVAALYAILHASQHNDSQMRAVVFTDSNYQIAIDKANTMRDTIQEFGGKILEYIDTPIAETASRMPTLTSRLLQDYGENFYSLAINDNYFTGMKATLKQQNIDGAGPPYNISAGDGDSPAFARIRKTDYQTATVPEPLYMQGWQLIDELNRAIAGAESSGYIAPVPVIDSSNITDDDVYDPPVAYRQVYRQIWGR